MFVHQFLLYSANLASGKTDDRNMSCYASGLIFCTQLWNKNKPLIITIGGGFRGWPPPLQSITPTSGTILEWHMPLLCHTPAHYII